jgi:hypothetical protein
MTTSAQELSAELCQHTGSDQLFHHSLVKSFNYTEGVRAFFQQAGQGAYWLGDILATEPAIKDAVRMHGFCIALLEVTGTSAVLTVARDMSTKKDAAGAVTGRTFDCVAFERLIDYTDCPEGAWKFYLTATETQGGRVILALLPTEY